MKRKVRLFLTEVVSDWTWKVESDLDEQRRRAFQAIPGRGNIMGQGPNSLKCVAHPGGNRKEECACRDERCSEKERKLGRDLGSDYMSS